MDPETAAYAFDVALCARCDFPIGDLACPRCAKTLRRRTVPPGSTPLAAGVGLDRALSWLEERCSASVDRLVLEIEGVLGRGARLVIQAELAGRRETLLVDNDATPDERGERTEWVKRTSRRRHLTPPLVDERYRLADRMSSPDVESFGMLLHARLARAHLALVAEGSFDRRSVTIEDEGGVVRCLVEFSERSTGRSLTIELATIPTDNARALAEVCAWVDALSRGWSGEGSDVKPENE